MQPVAAYSDPMRIAVVADVHANLEAFQAVLEHAASGGEIDEVWSLGDVVGYGPDPTACIALLHTYPQISIAGNHDYAATGAIGTEDFNPYAAEAARWTSRQLSLEDQLWLSNLSAVHIEGEFTLAHGSLLDPIWDYLTSHDGVREHLSHQATPYCLVGHSHLPQLYTEGQTRVLQDSAADGERVELGNRRLVINPGSVGQPRDGDPRAAYCVIDTDARQIEFHRVSYDVELTQAKMRAVGLPEYLAQRLEEGR
jgi:diadenosine tetraphosphatase ApaH/serine/threonine PP2A family protein phosphatase